MITVGHQAGRPGGVANSSIMPKPTPHVPERNRYAGFTWLHVVVVYPAWHIARTTAVLALQGIALAVPTFLCLLQVAGRSNSAQ